MKEPAHRALHPFGQIPTYEEGNLALFESGAIVFHIAERHAGLLPDDANARARAITWMFAALNTMEPPIVDREIATLLDRSLFERDEFPPKSKGMHSKTYRRLERRYDEQQLRWTAAALAKFGFTGRLVAPPITLAKDPTHNR